MTVQPEVVRMTKAKLRLEVVRWNALLFDNTPPFSSANAAE